MSTASSKVVSDLTERPSSYTYEELLKCSRGEMFGATAPAEPTTVITPLTAQASATCCPCQ